MDDNNEVLDDENNIEVPQDETPAGEETPEEETDEKLQEMLLKMRIEILNDATDTSQDAIFTEKINDAKGVALYVLYPYDDEAELPDTWRMNNWIVRCAIELYNKMSTLNIQSYSENGLSVSYLTGSISKILLDELMPKAGVIKYKKRCCCCDNTTNN